jgi:hypothetical protein
MVHLTLVGGPDPWPSRTCTVGVIDDRTLPDEAVRIVRTLVRSLLAGVEPEALEEDDEPEPEPGTLGL